MLHPSGLCQQRSRLLPTCLQQRGKLCGFICKKALKTTYVTNNTRISELKWVGSESTRVSPWTTVISSKLFGGRCQADVPVLKLLSCQHCTAPIQFQVQTHGFHPSGVSPGCSDCWTASHPADTATSALRRQVDPSAPAHCSNGAASPCVRAFLINSAGM